MRGTVTLNFAEEILLRCKGLIDHRSKTSELSRNSSEHPGGTTAISAQALTKIASFAAQGLPGVQHIDADPSYLLNEGADSDSPQNHVSRSEMQIIIAGESEDYALTMPVSIDRNQPQAELSRRLQEGITEVLESTAGVQVATVKIVPQTSK